MTTARRVRSGAAKKRAEASKELHTQDQVKRTTIAGYKVKGAKDYTDETSHEEILGICRLPPGVEAAYVRVAVGNTYNMQNYESLRIDVGVTLPCDPCNLDAAYVAASDFVAEKLAEEESQWMGKR